jgi:hypothetical protein
MATTDISAGKIGGNQMQGQGTLPNKVSVPLPGTDKTQSAYKGGMKHSPSGFDQGIKPGKI